MNRIHATNARRPQGAWSFVCAGMRSGRPQLAQLARLGFGVQPGPGRDVLTQVVST